MAGQIWAVNTLGGFLYSLNLSEELREALQPMARFRQFCDARIAAGKRRGETFTWDIVGNVATAGGTLVETNTMPESNFTIAQATLTITEYGNAVPYTGKLEALSKFEVRKPVTTALRNDAAKVLDRAAWAQFNRCALRYVGTSATTYALTTNGTATAVNTSDFNTTHAKFITDIMQERNIPAYSGEDYVAIAWPSTYRSIKNSMETLHQYTETGLKMIFQGEIGRYENFRFVKQTNVVKGVSTDGLTGTAWSQGRDWVFCLGEDTVGEGVAIPEEIRAKIPDDYGRSKGIAWYALLGFGIIHTTTNSTGASETRILKFDSAS